MAPAREKDNTPIVASNEVLDHQLHGLTTSKAARTVWSFASTLDLIIIAISCLAAVIAGGLNPLLTVLYGQFVASFDQFRNDEISSDALRADIARFSVYFVYLAIGMFVSVYVTTVGFYYTGERIARNLRKAYLSNVVRQNIAFFDTLGAGTFTTHITADITTIQEGLTGNLSVALTAVATCISVFVICFIEYWKLALVVTPTIVVLVAIGTVGVAYPVKWTKASKGHYNDAATIAEEAITSIRHVAASGIQSDLSQRYEERLKRAYRSELISNLGAAVMNGMIQAVPSLAYALSFWYGSQLLVKAQISLSGVTTITLAIVIAGWAVGRVAPNAKAFIASIASAASILQVIARCSPQDPFSEEGVRPGSSNADITFRKVELRYPSRPEVKVLEDFDLVIPANKTTALVGASGCGKSSIVGLIERFYVPTEGEIKLGDTDLQMLNLKWLRSQISLVGQEPILFDTTIFENILYGLHDTLAPDTDLQMLVETAAKKANAHDFVLSLPRQYQTRVGERGAQLSGGQRQRICIARAIIKDPRILLLDEATAALDVEAERSVQTALANVTSQRTTIMIAHRLSTIRNADNIVVMKKGSIVEQGTHDFLLSQEGHYASLVAAQSISERAEGVEQHTVDDEAPEADPEKVEDRSFDLEYGHTKEFSATDADAPTASQPSNTEKASFVRAVKLIHRLNRPELHVTIVAVILSLVAGLSVPAQSLIFARVVDALSSRPFEFLRNRTDFWCLMYFVTGLGMLLIWVAQGSGFAYTTAKLTRRGQTKAFRHLLRQDIAYFEAEENTAGSLTSLLSSAPQGLTGLGGPIVGALISFVGTIFGGIILSLAIGWKLALVCTATIPIVAGFGWIRLAVMNLFAQKMKKTHQESAAYAGEMTSAIRTVASLGLEARTIDHYSSILERKSRQAIHSILQASILYAASQAVVFLCAALAFWYGGGLIANREYSIYQFFVCFAALISGSQVAGFIFAYAPGISRATTAASDLGPLLERRPAIDIWATDKQKIARDSCKGRIEFRDVGFSYSSRDYLMAIQGFNITVQPGTFVALVGHSGSGKSTIIALLERFFNPTVGQILLDGMDISKLDVNSYRSCISLVSQETIIYSGTIKDNLLLGSADNTTQDELVEACKDANIYDVISSLPQGFNTDVGSKGVMLSGGQRQRLAIARALLRKTKVLLLDEATSALDSTSEKVVQAALDKAAKSRTTIAIAHRLSTIRHADVIYVLDQGKIAEAGNHDQLVARKGLYWTSVEKQRLQ